MPRFLAAADTDRKQYLSLRPHLVFILLFIHTPENGCGDYQLNTPYYTSFIKPNNLSYLLSNFVFLSLKDRICGHLPSTVAFVTTGLSESFQHCLSVATPFQRVRAATRSNLPVMSEKQNMHFKKYAKGKMLRKSPKHEANI